MSSLDINPFSHFNPSGDGRNVSCYRHDYLAKFVATHRHHIERKLPMPLAWPLDLCEVFGHVCACSSRASASRRHYWCMLLNRMEQGGVGPPMQTCAARSMFL